MNIVVVAIGDVAMGVHASYGSLIFGSIGAAVIGVILELFFFSVDYSRSENLQYEDDEYYYYVKAVPKIVVSTPEKTVKRINERQETEIMDTAEVRKKAKKQAHCNMIDQICQNQDFNNICQMRIWKIQFLTDGS